MRLVAPLITTKYLTPLKILDLLCHYLQFSTGMSVLHPRTDSVIQMGEKASERFDKPQRTAGCLGDIDFVGVSRTKGKVNYYITILPKTLGHPLLMKGFTTLVISMTLFYSNMTVSLCIGKDQRGIMIQSVWKNLTGLQKAKSLQSYWSTNQSSSSTLTESSFIFDPCLIHRGTRISLFLNIKSCTHGNTKVVKPLIRRG